MMRGMWMLARLDLLLWRRMPLAIVSALIPPFGMALLLVVLTLSVGVQPVALVVLSQGKEALRMVRIIEADEEAYALTITDARNAAHMLDDQEVAAVITIPADFDQAVSAHQARLELTLNNVDIDFADDIRRAVDRSVAQFDAPQLGLEGERDNADDRVTLPNPYRVAIIEHDLRETNVDFLSYQVLPTLVLLVLNVGLIGTALLCAHDKERGTARYLALAPLASWVLIAGRLLGGLLASLAALVPTLIVCVLTGVITPPADHWPALAALFVATGLCASGLGATLGSLIRGARTVAMASSVVATYLFFLGGGFTTIVFLPAWLRNLSAVIPIRYSIDGMRQALFYPGLEGLNTDIAILVGTALAAVVAGSIAVRRSWST